MARFGAGVLGMQVGDVGLCGITGVSPSRRKLRGWGVGNEAAMVEGLYFAHLGGIQTLPTPAYPPQPIFLPSPTAPTLILGEPISGLGNRLGGPHVWMVVWVETMQKTMRRPYCIWRSLNLWSIPYSDIWLWDAAIFSKQNFPKIV